MSQKPNLVTDCLSKTSVTNIDVAQLLWLNAYHLIVDEFDLFEDFPSFMRFRQSFGLPFAISSTSSLSSASFLFNGKSDCISDRWSTENNFYNSIIVDHDWHVGTVLVLVTVFGVFTERWQKCHQHQSSRLLNLQFSSWTLGRRLI